MEEKKITENQKLINKIKYLRSLSPSSSDHLNRKRESKEIPEESIKYDSQINDFSSPNNQLSSRERDSWNENKQMRNKNKSKNKTTHKNKKTREYDNNNYQIIDSSRNKDDSIDKKSNIYENQRENFFNKYMTKARENGLEEVPNYENKNPEKKPSPDFSHINNNEKIMDLIEIIKNKNKKYEDSNNINYYSNKPNLNNRKKKGKDK